MNAYFVTMGCFCIWVHVYKIVLMGIMAIMGTVSNATKIAGFVSIVTHVQIVSMARTCSITNVLLTVLLGTLRQLF